MIHQEMIVEAERFGAGQGEGTRASQDELEKDSTIHPLPNSDVRGQGEIRALRKCLSSLAKIRDLQDPVQNETPRLLVALKHRTP